MKFLTLCRNKIYQKTGMVLMLAGILCGVAGCAGLPYTGFEAADAPTQETEAENPEKSVEQTELTILAAASLTDVCGELEALYEEENPDVTLTFSFGSSGALQTQIEEGAPADIFFSASTKQMDALRDEGLMDNDSITELLENKIVLVVPKDSTTELASFEEVATDQVSMIGLGEPESVPAGQYAEEVFTSLGILEAVRAKANYGSDVRTVLSWVEEASVDCGVVYATDAQSSELVRVIAEAPEGSCKRVIYPVGVIGASEQAETSRAFIDFLQSDTAMELFEAYGFSPVE